MTSRATQSRCSRTSRHARAPPAQCQCRRKGLLEWAPNPPRSWNGPPTTQCQCRRKGLLERAPSPPRSWNGPRRSLLFPLGTRLLSLFWTSDNERLVHAPPVLHPRSLCLPAEHPAPLHEPGHPCQILDPWRLPGCGHPADRSCVAYAWEEATQTPELQSTPWPLGMLYISRRSAT